MFGSKPLTPSLPPSLLQCNAVPINTWYLARTIDLLAELDHVDHHLYPRYVLSYCNVYDCARLSLLLSLAFFSLLDSHSILSQEKVFPLSRLTPSHLFHPSFTHRKAKRDSYMGIDVFYWTFLWPGR